MAASDAEGWYVDPAGRHQFRWFSAGAATGLVRDSGATAQDPVTEDEVARFRTVELQEPPDKGRLLHTTDATPPHFEIINVGAGPVAMVNTAGDPYRQVGTPPSMLAIALTFGVPVVGWSACVAADAPIWVYLAIAGFSVLVAVAYPYLRRK